ncbi:hypothetical protein SCB49_04940 [unidentified eubacterium SCB49]|nr:hypothetical protein SCB49_04940 [unidentified eubacterium SCB49]
MSVFQNIKLYGTFLLLFISSISVANTTLHKDFTGLDIPEKIFCDICSCATSSGSTGFGTLSNANFFGVRYMYQNFESRNGIFENSPLSEEKFNTFQLWAQISVYKNFYVTANLPYQDLNKTLNGVSENLSGFGDASAIGWYKHVFYKKETEETIDFSGEKTPSGHSLQFGLGVKVPTGKFEQELTDSVNPGFQVGTGSVDGIFSLGHNYAGDKLGVNTLLSYYAKGENKNEYQFGDQFSYSSRVFTVMSTQTINFMPFVGVSGDVYSEIKQYGETIANSNGNIVNGSLGLEVVYKKFIFGSNYTLPVYQDLFGGNVNSKQRVSVYFNIAI